MNGEFSGIARPNPNRFKVLDELSQRSLPVPPISPVGSPKHYDGYKVLEFIESVSLPFLEGNVVKYTCRHSKKNGVADIDKAIDYLNQIKRIRYSDAHI